MLKMHTWSLRRRRRRRRITEGQVRRKRTLVLLGPSSADSASSRGPFL
jgi:hypothetical protein